MAYLRVQDARISRYIKAKRDLIGLIAEQRRVLQKKQSYRCKQNIAGSTELRHS